MEKNAAQPSPPQAHHHRLPIAGDDDDHDGVSATINPRRRIHYRVQRRHRPRVVEQGIIRHHVPNRPSTKLYAVDIRSRVNRRKRCVGGVHDGEERGTGEGAVREVGEDG